MAITSLKEFHSNFGTDPAEVTIQVDKDVSFSVFLKPLTSKDRDAFESSVVGSEGKRNLQNLRARLVQKCWVDEKGKAIGSIEEVGECRADVLGEIFKEVQKMNGMDAEAEEEAGND